MKIYCRFLSFLFVCCWVSTSLVAQDLVTKQTRLPCLNKKLSIVAHIVRDTMTNEVSLDEETILNAIAATNEDFAPICVSFEVCEFRIIDNYQYDTLDREKEWPEMLDLYHQKNRINMFFVAGTEAGGICGFAGLGSIGNVNGSGITIIKSNCVTRGTISHEMGHYFGLAHTFEGSGEELVDGSNCETAGDGICDTPSDPYVEDDPVEEYVDVENDCRFISQKQDENGQFYQPDVGNLMSYYPGDCACGFTHGQYLKMAETCTNSANAMW